MTTTQSINPGPRWGHTFVYDPIRDNILFFGGTRERGTFLNDTWTWDGNSWTQHQISSPPPRGFSAATFHADRGTILLHGGRSNERTTHYDNSSLDHHAMTYDIDRGQIVIFGGKNYRYDLSGKTRSIENSTVTPLVYEGPSPRHSIGLTYDRNNNDDR